MTYISFKKSTKTEFSNQFKKIILRYKCIGYNVDVIGQCACLVVYSMAVNNVAALLIACR